MLKISQLTDQELKQLLEQPMTNEEAKTLVEINQFDRWLLRQVLSEIDVYVIEEFIND